MLTLSNHSSNHIEEGSIPTRKLASALSKRSLWTPISVSSSPSCVTTFPVARHRAEAQIEEGALAARKAWLDLMPGQDLRTHSAGPDGNFFALCWPYGKTERVKLATEIIETLWLYDDLIEDVPHTEALQTHASLRDSFGSAKDAEKPSRKTVIAGLFKQFGDRMSKLDPKGTPRVIDALKSYLANYDSQKGGELPNIAEYTEYRILNVGFWIMESFMLWTMGITLDKAEQEMCHEFALSAGRAMGLTNDLYSWNVERHDRGERQWNAVPVIMESCRLCENDAIVFVKGLVIHHEQETRRLGLELQKRSGNSHKIQKYIKATGFMLGGNCFWSSSCPRYNPAVNEKDIDSSSSSSSA
ncbi:unnamed protein product [Clonostachys chloroleuca]|uniref:Terpenoid synthase n=1 Tax=Clonostachys chloroleuca TaxID=1926264 RepID=A0AA35LTK5_9HYPO|nr:unnamed protein product [Clonostachys chloroleuca]